MVAGTTTVTGDNFFPTLVRHIPEVLDVSYAILTELVVCQAKNCEFEGK
ncbi:hypothetical protein [Trichormus azollae]